MLKSIPGLLAIALSIGAFTPLTYAENIFQGNSSSVFVMTNDNTKSEILTYQRSSNEQYVLKAYTTTGGRGSGGTTDPLQSQGSLTLSHDHNLLFAINSGSGTISSFHLLGGLPILVDQEPTGNGAIVAFRADGLGRLQQIPNATATLTATNSGGSSISFSPDGKTLVVIEKAPNNIDTFPIHPDGTLGSVVVNHSVTPGVFSVVFTPNGQLIVSEDQTNGTDVSSISSYTINADGTITAISQNLPTLGDGTCWNAITPNGAYVYADNSATSTVAGFSVGSNGALTPIAGTILQL
jgi:6-phosphogluconolactonase